MVDNTIWSTYGYELALNTVALLVTVIISVLLCYKPLQTLQQSKYRHREFVLWWQRGGKTYFYRFCFLSFLSVLCMAIFVASFGGFAGWRFLGFGLFIGLSIIFKALTQKGDNTPLVMTKRMIRLHVVVFVLLAIVATAISFVPTHMFDYAFLGLMPIWVFPVCVVANWAIKPLENKINQGYINKAKHKLQSMMTVTIGITGSFGKTSAKNILHAMLSQKYKVCASPYSYNTPMGIVRTVNDHLSEEHQILILEMGARYKGDIAQLTSIVSPEIALLTSVGYMHIDTMQSYQGVLDTKFEIVEGLKANGKAFLDGTNDDIRDKLQTYTKERGDSANTSEASNRHIQWVDIGGSANTSAQLVGSSKDNIYASAIKITSSGTQFDIVVGQEHYSFSTSLLGRHVPSLVAMCTAVALELGVDINDIILSVAQLQSVPHRLQLLLSGNRVVIDNAYSSNLIGATHALEVLAQFEGRQKIIITPGIVEQGHLEEEINLQLGQQIGKVCDYALLIGSRAQYIRQGIQENSVSIDTYPQDLETPKTGTEIIVLDSRDEAVKYLNNIVGDVAVLFENDLPDNIS